MDSDDRPIIVGGGVAGLAAANHLCDLGRPPLLIEAGTYPVGKVCGEFLSPECLPILRHWDIVPATPIRTCEVYAGKSVFHFTFPKAAATLSRATLDTLLAERAASLGAEIRTGTRVETLPKSDCLLLGTGRLFGKRPKLIYTGVKAHLPDQGLEDRLLLHSFKGGYMGWATVDGGQTNVAALAKGNLPIELPNPLIVEAPRFGIRKTPHWPNTYFIGDAAGAIAPASGDGLAMGITSGVMAAEFALKNDWEGFRRAWHRRYSSRIRWGNLLHFAMMRPHIAKWGVYLPHLVQTCFKMTRDR